MIASGELGENPEIHVWNSRTLLNIQILKGVHKSGVHLMSFTKNDTFLVTCGLTLPSAIIIYDWKNNMVLISS